MNFLLLAALLLPMNFAPAAARYTAREVFEKCRAQTVSIDSALDRTEIRFTQKIEMVSRGGDKDNLVFRITVRHGKFERDLVSGTVPNGSRFDAGYDAFDRMFRLSEYFTDKGTVLSSCELDDPDDMGNYNLKFAFSEPSNEKDPMTDVTAVVDPSDFAPSYIHEHIRGLPLGMEFDDIVNVSYDNTVKMYFPDKIVMRIYGKLFFLHGEIGKITILNQSLEKL